MHIQLVACLLVFESFVACQQTPEKLPPMAADIGLASVDLRQADAKNVPTPAANIVFQSTDGGQTWQDVSAGLPTDLAPEAVFTSSGDALSGGEVFIGTSDGLYRSRSTSGAPNWTKSFALEGRIVDVWVGRSAVYACNYGSGVYRSFLGMDLWEPISLSLEDKQVRTVLETPDGGLVVGTDRGMYKSADGGKTWKQVFNDGIILNLSRSGNVLIAGGKQGVLRSTDGGEHWQNVLNENILAKQTGVIGDRFVTIFGTRDPRQLPPEGVTSRLRTSADGGQTWQRIDQALLPAPNNNQMDARLAQVRDLYDVVQVGEQLFCSFDTGIYRSADQGRSWEPVFSLERNGSFRLGVSGGVIYAVVGGGC